MGENLKPCPFCGGEAQVVRKPYEPKFCVGCGDDACLGFSGLGWLYETEDHAAAAWNRRAERTCREEWVPGSVGGTSVPVCSNCGRGWEAAEVYCPRCGAKVVGE